MRRRRRVLSFAAALQKNLFAAGLLTDHPNSQAALTPRLSVEGLGLIETGLADCQNHASTPKPETLRPLTAALSFLSAGHAAESLLHCGGTG